EALRSRFATKLRAAVCSQRFGRRVEGPRPPWMSGAGGGVRAQVDEAARSRLSFKYCFDDGPGAAFVRCSVLILAPSERRGGEMEDRVRGLDCARERCPVGKIGDEGIDVA